MHENFLLKKLEQRQQQNALRSLRLPGRLIDFCSNDYLGLATSNFKPQTSNLPSGAAGSRLLAGNYELIETAERELAAFHQSEAALIFNSGYDANLGLLSSVPQRGDTVLYDYLSHASLRDGIRLSFAQSHSFAHNNINELEQQLQHAKGNLFVVTESVFSMDGDFCPLQEMVALCKKYNAHLIVDEAHATGVTGERGEGLVQMLGLQQDCFARIHTFGKACGAHGAVVLGSPTLRSYLINFARSFIYSTALPPLTVQHIRKSYAQFPLMQKERAHLRHLIAIFQSAFLPFQKLVSQTPIQGVVIPGNDAARAAAAHLQQEGFDVRPILYPTVPAGAERLRIVLHSFNTEEELNGLIGALRMQ
jgi:8-amino-7-oxononanoate synthase